jgi:hypothetical protein
VGGKINTFIYKLFVSRESITAIADKSFLIGGFTILFVQKGFIFAQ